MRVVEKEPEPGSFSAWKAMENEKWIPHYSNLQNPQKSELHSALIAEQGMTCCYCGVLIDGTTSHIEHFLPQHPFEYLELEYINLFASCGREVPKGCPLQCGHRKSDWHDHELMISPLEANCDTHFQYELDGRIKSLSTRAAAMTEHLGLDLPLPTAGRAEALAGVFTEDFLQNANLDDVLEMQSLYSQRGQSGANVSYFQAIVRFAEALMLDGNPS